MLETITRENEPLNEAIQQLTEWLNESKRDREALHVIVTEHSKKISEQGKLLDKHDDLLIVLKTINGLGDAS